MGFHESLAGMRVMVEVNAQTIASGMGLGDLDDGAINGPGFGLPRRQTHHGADRRGLCAGADIDIMAVPVDAVDAEIAALMIVIGSASLHHLANDRPNHLCGYSIDAMDDGPAATARGRLARKNAVQGKKVS